MSFVHVLAGTLMLQNLQNLRHVHFLLNDEMQHLQNVDVHTYLGYGGPNVLLFGDQSVVLYHNTQMKVEEQYVVVANLKFSKAIFIYQGKFKIHNLFYISIRCG